MATKNLGLVQSIKSSTSPPSNTTMLWYNTGINSYTRYRHHFYNTSTSKWELLSDSVKYSPTETGSQNFTIPANSVLLSIDFKLLSGTPAGRVEVVSSSGDIISEILWTGTYSINNLGIYFETETICYIVISGGTVKPTIKYETDRI